MITPLTWQKSSFSGGGTGDSCVELAAPTTVLTTTPTALHALLTTIKTGNDLPG